MFKRLDNVTLYQQSGYHKNIPELKQAEQQFNFATTHEDIDNAIMQMNIAEQKVILHKSTAKNTIPEPINEEPTFWDRLKNNFKGGQK